eukprot:scaffold1882_cov384-Prasinococcus_capsulatus_cf.AAC.11
MPFGRTRMGPHLTFWHLRATRCVSAALEPPKSPHRHPPESDWPPIESCRDRWDGVYRWVSLEGACSALDVQGYLRGSSLDASLRGSDFVAA